MASERQMSKCQKVLKIRFKIYSEVIFANALALQQASSKLPIVNSLKYSPDKLKSGKNMFSGLVTNLLEYDSE